MGLRGRHAAGRLEGGLFKDWTLRHPDHRRQRPAADAGLSCRRCSGTGVTGSIRPDYTGAPLYDAPAGLFLNPPAVRRASSRAMGQRRAELHHRPGAVLAERLAGPHVPR